jgi:hypothetical protein
MTCNDNTNLSDVKAQEICLLCNFFIRQCQVTNARSQDLNFRYFQALPSSIGRFYWEIATISPVRRTRQSASIEAPTYRECHEPRNVQNRASFRRASSGRGRLPVASRTVIVSIIPPPAYHQIFSVTSKFF